MDVGIRQRSGSWFVAGVVATLVVGIVATQAWRVGAAPGDEETNLVPISPCRLADTRPGADRVGTAGTLSAQDTTTFQATGDNGDCTGIPDEAVGVSLNVTALRATERTFITIWPSGDLPTASSLNPDAGQPPVPNAVTTRLSDSGSFQVYNDAGSVDLIIDVNGYLLPSGGVTDFEVVVVNVPVNLNVGESTGQTAECPPGKLMVSGGASIIPDNSGDLLYLRSSVPRSDLLGWSGRVGSEAFGSTGTLNIYAVCASGVIPAP
jgi:hypothetical protein